MPKISDLPLLDAVVPGDVDILIDDGTTRRVKVAKLLETTATAEQGEKADSALQPEAAVNLLAETPDAKIMTADERTKLALLDATADLNKPVSTPQQEAINSLSNTLSTYTDDKVADEYFSRAARVTFRGSPLIVEGDVLLMPAVDYYSPRDGNYQTSAPPDSGLSAAAYWAVPLVTPDGQEARIYYDLGEATDGNPPFAITTDAPFVSSETQIIVAVVRDGRVIAMPGVAIVGRQNGGVGANQVRYGKAMDKAQRLLGLTSISDITSVTLQYLGFGRGAANFVTLKPYVGSDLPAHSRSGQRAFGRCYVEATSDFGFGTPTMAFYGANGVELGSQAMLLERVLSARAASFLWRGTPPSGAITWRMGIEDPAGQTILLTGLQFATGEHVEWIARDDYPAPAVPRLSAKRIQAVSTRFRVLREFVGSPTFTRTESRLKAFAPSVPVHGLRLIYGNFIVAGGGTGEFDGYNAITVTSAVEPEYSPAVVIAATFNGRREVTLDPGALVMSDPVPGLSLNGEDFWVRTGLTVSASGKWPQGYYAFADGEGVYDSSSGVSQVYATGAMSAPSGGAPAADGGYGPIAVVGYTEEGQVSVVYLADSLGDGVGDTTVTLVDGYIARALQDVDGEAMPYIRLSRGSDKLYTNTLPFGYRRRAMFDYGTHGIVALGTNDIADGASLAALKDLVLEISTAMRARGMKVIGATIPPRTTSTNDWEDTDNQTPVAGFGVGEMRDQFNAWIKINADGLIDYWYDINEAVEAPDAPGKWNVNGLPNYATDDGIHLTTYFHVLAAGVLNRLLRTLSID